TGTPWQNGPIPLAYAITGLGPIIVRVSRFEAFKEVLEKVFLFAEVDQDNSFHLFEVGEGGNGARVIVEDNAVLPNAIQGYGTVHHAALRVDRKSTRLNSSHVSISYAVFCLKKNIHHS